MSRRCELTGKTAQVGHKVSHSNIKTKRRFLPNLLNVTMISDALGRSVKLRVSANALKTVDHRGGLDAFLMKAKDDALSPQGARAQAANPQEARRGGVGFCPPHARARVWAAIGCAAADGFLRSPGRGHGSASVNCSSSVR